MFRPQIRKKLENNLAEAKKGPKESVWLMFCVYVSCMLLHCTVTGQEPTPEEVEKKEEQKQQIKDMQSNTESQDLASCTTGG